MLFGIYQNIYIYIYTHMYISNFIYIKFGMYQIIIEIHRRHKTIQKYIEGIK